MDKIVSFIIVLLLISISVYLIWKEKILGFVAAVAIIGSDTDSAGIMYAIIEYIPFYKVIIRGATLILFVYVIIRIYQLYRLNKIKKEFFLYYFITLLTTSALIVIINLFRGEGIIISLSELIWLGTPFFFLWILGSQKIDSEKSLIRLLVIQASVTILILILGPITKEINGASYQYILGDDEWKFLGPYVVNAKISFFNFDKRSFDVMKFAQFHNPNSLGVYSTAYIATGSYLFLKYRMKLEKFLIALFLILIGITGWFNSLTRGPIFMVGVVFLIIILRKFTLLKHRTKLIITIPFLFLAFLLREKLFELAGHFFLSIGDVSIMERLEGYAYAFETIKMYPQFGAPLDPENPVPHILPLKIMTYYGVFAGVCLTIPFIHISVQTVKKFFAKLKTMSYIYVLYPTLLVAIILGAMLTNGVVVYVLFWVMFAEAAIQFKLVWKVDGPVVVQNNLID